MTTFGYREKLILTTRIKDKVIESSTVFDEQTKHAFKNLSKITRDFLESNSNLNSYQLKTLANELLTYWNESITLETETFWSELRANGVDFERKEPLRFALDKKRFRYVEQGIHARNYWPKLKLLSVIQKKFSNREIELIDRIIAEDENRRLEILKKCLRKKEIPQTQYLKFGECMAYFANCRLFDIHFKTEEVEELSKIWKNFKSK